jgi:hypothetical protein
MANLPLIVRQLKKERDRVERQLSGLNAALTGVCQCLPRDRAQPQTAEDVGKE